VAAALGYLMIRKASEFSSVNAGMESANRRLQALGGQARFPHEENVGRVEENLARVEAFFLETMGGFLAQQRGIKPMEPARFPQALQRFVGDMNQAAVSNGVAVPPRFLYGFERYSRGQPPAKRDVGRLLRQSQAIEEILRALFERRILQLSAIERHVFEDDRPMAIDDDAGEEISDPRTPAAGFARDPAGLFEKERLVFTFTAREQAVWQIMNALPSLSLFCVVADIDIANEAAKPVPVNPADGTPRAPGVEVEAGVAAVAATPAAAPAPGAPAPRPPIQK